MRSRPKRLSASLLLIFSGQVFAAIDSYQWCQVHVDKVRELSQFSPEKLNELRRFISNATTPEELNLVSNVPFDVAFKSIKEHNGYTDEKARTETFKLIKYFEITPVNAAIKQNGVIDESTWTSVYEQCVKDNDNSLLEFE